MICSSHPQRIGPYQLLRPLPGAAGGMARLYLARPAQGPGRLVLKVAAAPQHSDFIKAEAECLRGLEHPHILRLLPINGLQAPGEPAPVVARLDPRDRRSPWFIALEYLAGGSLDRLLARRGPLPIAQAVAVARQLALALAHLHARGLAHLDLKPANVLLRAAPAPWARRPPEVVLADFGLAWPLGRPCPGPLYGSAPYLAPERAAGAPPHQQHDIFALGALLYELLTGRPPFAQSAPPGAALDRSLWPAALRPRVGPKLEQVVLRAIATDPAQRFQNVRQLRRALDLLPSLERAPAKGPKSPPIRRLFPTSWSS